MASTFICPSHHKNAVTYFKKRERNKAITKCATRQECVLHDNPTYACSTRLQMTMTRDCRHFKAACTAYQSKSLNIHLFYFFPASSLHFPSDASLQQICALGEHTV